MWREIGLWDFWESPFKALSETAERSPLFSYHYHHQKHCSRKTEEKQQNDFNNLEKGWILSSLWKHSIWIIVLKKSKRF